MKKIYLFGFLPIIGFVIGALFSNKVTPYILGMPFFHFSIVLWSFLTTAILGLIYLFDPANKEEEIK
ncbi:DUF3311 domain-containing protein [Gottfriedia acidiceleris]|uniref:DUF3311 domain-containing protein n=1 Tax=Gottfriedia acidiceleris TaxID=371036 RepID=UPI002FFE3D41